MKLTTLAAPCAFAHVAVLLACTALPACSTQTAEEVDSQTAVPVTVAAATIGSIRGRVNATGVVRPAPDAELVVVAPEPSRVAEVPHAEGDRVQRGDVLVRFEIPSAVADVQRQAAEVQRAQAALANAKANQMRAHDLFDSGIAARKEVEDADRMVADAEAGLAQAEAARGAASVVAARSVVRATFDGVIAKRFHNPGDSVEAAASDPVLRVIDPRRLEVIAAVPLTDASRIVVGASARLSAVPAGSPDVTLKVVSRPAAVEQGTATVPVRLAFSQPTNLVAGTPVQIDIAAEQHTNVVLIPAPALVREGDETAVFVAADDKAQRRVVQTGITDAMHAEIVMGIKAGEMVITDGQAGLPDGATITINTGEAAADKAETAPAPDAAAGKDDKK